MFAVNMANLSVPRFYYLLIHAQVLFVSLKTGVYFPLSNLLREWKNLVDRRKLAAKL